MALIGNHSLINRTPIRQFATGISSQYAATFTPPSAVKNRFYGAFPKISATPNGYLAPSAWVLPMTGGGMSSYQQANAAISTTGAALYSGINAEAAITGSIAITQAILDQIVSLVASLTGSISVTDAQLAAISELIASITASMTVTDAQIGAIIDMIASLSGSISANASPFATAEISADIGGATPLSPEGLAQSLLNALLADYNLAGSVGEALNNVGASGNPWASALSSNNDPGTFGEQVQKLLTQTKFLGLK